ncbi:hypothetical protein [Neorhizobium sp. DT-125]|uniref:hypothetical protein n=1 Tax=Neorhizobium sp. DT-125 TaxID=3396163 RepID=UPI003F1BC5E2
MPDSLKIGFILFILGLVLWTIGGMISFVTRYDVHNRHIRAEFAPLRPKEQGQFKELWDAYFNNPKSKWWCRIGFGLCSIGMAIHFFHKTFLQSR